MNLIQFETNKRRGVARIEGDKAIAVRNINRMTELAQSAIRMGLTLEEAVEEMGDGEVLDYPALLAAGEVMAPLDHPDGAHCFVTGTGLTHLGSAAARDEMHRKAAAETGNESDSIKMFNLGLKGGKPRGGGPGEEPEIVGLYVIGVDRRPWRLGFTIGNEFSDHVLERQNYLYLAHSKLRACSIGPELRAGALPDNVAGESRII